MFTFQMGHLIKRIDDLLLLIISFTKAVNIALEVAKAISKANSGPPRMMFLVNALTLVIAEPISNNATDELGVSSPCACWWRPPCRPAATRST